MQNRSIKWAPFNSVINDKEIKKELLFKHTKISKPILSEDQILDLNNKIFEAYTNNIEVNISYFKTNNIINKIGYINNINIDKKYIIFNKNIIYLNQILKINEFY